MENLEAYLKGEYRRHQSQMEQVEDLLRRAATTLVNVFDPKKGWPYEVSSASQSPSRFSLSTTSMISVSLGLATGRIKSLAPTPLLQVPHVLEESDGVKKVLDKALLLLLRQSSSNERSRGHAKTRVNYKYLFASDTFGRDDPFTLCWLSTLIPLIEDASLRSADKQHRKCLKKHLRKANSRLLEYCTDTPDGDLLVWPDRARSDTGHSFPLLRTVHILKRLPPGKEADREKRIRVLEKCFWTRVHQHLAYDSIANSQFDAAELVFSLEGALRCGQHPDAVDEGLVRQFFSVMRERQKHSLYWRPLRPFITSPQGLILLPLSVEVANSLMRVCDLLEDAGNRDISYFSEYFDIFQRYFEWLRTKTVHVKCHEGRHAGETYTGWHSEHNYDSHVIHPWHTAMVIAFLMHFRVRLQGHIAGECRVRGGFRFDLIERPSEGRNATPSECWARNWEEKAEPLSAEKFTDTEWRVLARIRERYIEPRDQEAKITEKPHYSMLLYGPPGTGKTAIAEELARALRWPLLIITPSDFLRKGTEGVEACASAIFRGLEEQNGTVVLFDEIDRMILDRSTHRYEAQGDIFQFMTPSMLVKLRNLRKRKKCIFIIATNYVERIDPAVKRKGRLDDLFLVAPPDQERRRAILRECLVKHFGARTRVKLEKLRERVKKLDLDEVARMTVFATYGELDRFVEDVVDTSRSMPDKRTVGELKKAWDRNTQIRLEMYKQRFFNKDEEVLLEGKPDNELCLLAYLAHEASDTNCGEPAKSAKDLLTKRFGANLQNEFQEVPLPEPVRGSLVQWIKP